MKLRLAFCREPIMRACAATTRKTGLALSSAMGTHFAKSRSIERPDEPRLATEHRSFAAEACTVVFLLLLQSSAVPECWNEEQNMNLLSRFGGRLWDPWREIGQLQHEMGRLLTGARAMTGLGPREYPPVNLYVNEHDILLTLELPGIDPSKVEVTVTGDAVSVRGDRPKEVQQTSQNFHRRERPSGAFDRKVELPYEVDPAKTSATFERGVLKVKLARPESQRPRKVSVSTS